MAVPKAGMAKQFTRKANPKEPPICGLCGVRITVAEMIRGDFEAIEGKSGYLAYYHRDCVESMKHN